ncbi:DNA-binding transcriptional LysR family regulator [Mycoplana sp. BE70]|uniref:LysR family transcriptional regulator n=1 Tax=Mycoplana sp. BE70 TaxID=2817775 RepID=UPI00285D1258|nr:LysR family transcriptional regulator [Mycoplana sp. BE70]MDR6756364.1 DNA-binding transcriptional LysR family regulator [Mycoplana sp. BE70]
MEFRHLQTFVAIAECGSFSLAAEQLNMSQSAVSQTIRRLEEELKEPLFLRNARQCEITEAGRNLLPQAQSLLQQRQALLPESDLAPEEYQGRIRVGTSTSGTSFIWARLYQAFGRTYPNIKLDIRTTSHTEQTAEDILHGALDIGFLPIPYPHRDPRIRQVVLGHHRTLIVVSPNHPLANAKGLRPADIAGEKFVLYERGINFRALSDHFFALHGITPEIASQSNDTHLIRTLTEIESGIAFLPDWAAADLLEQGRLVALDINTDDLCEQLGAAFIPHRMTRVARLFLAFARNRPDLFPAVTQRPLPEGWRHFTETAGQAPVNAVAAFDTQHP